MLVSDGVKIDPAPCLYVCSWVVREESHSGKQGGGRRRRHWEIGGLTYGGLGATAI